MDRMRREDKHNARRERLTGAPFNEVHNWAAADPSREGKILDVCFASFLQVRLRGGLEA